MPRLIVVRLLLSVMTLVLVSLIVFWAAELLPGDAARAILGRGASQEQITVLRERLRLNDPAPVRYGRWLTGVVRGDWGQSLAGQRPVVDMIGPQLRNTALLAGVALVFATLLSGLAGIVSALTRDGPADVGISVLALLGMSLPEFVVGTLLVIGFAVTWPLFPALSLIDTQHDLTGLVQVLTLPVLTLTTVMSAYGVRMLRDNLIDVLTSDYVRMATLKGVPRWQVVWRHALPNALLPFINITALNLAWLIGGVVVVETVFSFPGLGRLLVDAVSNRDVPLIEGTALVMAALYVLANLAADLAGILVNPRLRSG
jgi:peptide/nickel transport system permease protein